MRIRRLCPVQYLVYPLLAAALPVLTAVGADQAAGRRDKHRGVVDGSLFVELAGEEGSLVEISLHGPLLKQVGRSFAKSEEPLGQFLKDIESINAVVLGDGTKAEKTKPEVNKLIKQLENQGWDRLGRVREEDSEVLIFVLNSADGETLDGLTVLVSGSDELVFVNLAGRINLEYVADLGVAMGLPGLDDLGSPEWKKQIHGYEKSRLGEKTSGGER